MNYRPRSAVCLSIPLHSLDQSSSRRDGIQIVVKPDVVLHLDLCRSTAQKS